MTPEAGAQYCQHCKCNMANIEQVNNGEFTFCSVPHMVEYYGKYYGLPISGLHNGGLTKLTEESGELVQAISKYVTLKAENPAAFIHWDNSNIVEHLEDELADVLAAARAVIDNLQLDEERINKRYHTKLALFEYWHKGGKESFIKKETKENDTRK